MSSKKIKNFDADQGLDSSNLSTTASATEATGMMFDPPHDKDELSSIRDMHTLQSTEFAATQFGEMETDYSPYMFHRGENGHNGSGRPPRTEPQRSHTEPGRHGHEPYGDEAHGNNEARQGRSISGGGEYPEDRSRPENKGRRGSKRHDSPAEFDPELAKVDPDINCSNGNDDRHASMRPLSVWDWSNGEGAK